MFLMYQLMTFFQISLVSITSLETMIMQILTIHIKVNW